MPLCEKVNVSRKYKPNFWPSRKLTVQVNPVLELFYCVAVGNVTDVVKVYQYAPSIFGVEVCEASGYRSLHSEKDTDLRVQVLANFWPVLPMDQEICALSF
jgi:hypothetical protein